MNNSVRLLQLLQDITLQPQQQTNLHDRSLHGHQSVFMDQRYRSSDVLRRNLRVLNQKADRDLQQKLNMLDKQYRYALKMLHQRTDSLVKQQSRVVMVKVCEPKAIVSIAMEEIGEQSQFSGIQTSNGRRLYSSVSQYHHKGSDPVEHTRSISAPVRHRGNVQCSVSLMQMKEIAKIDSISEKELLRQQQRAQEELERLRQFQRESLHKRVAAFVEQLKDKRNMQRNMGPP